MFGCFDRLAAAGSPYVPTFQKGCADSGTSVHQSAPFLQTTLVKDFACLNVCARSVEGDRSLLALRTMQLLLP